MPAPDPESPSENTPATAAPLAAGAGVAELETALRQLVTTKAWDITRPLPTTRELGTRYRISNASVCRLLLRLKDEGTIWRRDNGRYFLNESRRLYARRKPHACLLRKLEHWSRTYQGIMSGVSQALGPDRAALLFVHNESLVRHADTAFPPHHADAEAQRELLAEFFRDHDRQFHGILLDEVWLDEALREFAPQLAHAVLVGRPTALPELSSVSADIDASAQLAVAHLFSRGFDTLWLAVPFENSVAIQLMKSAVRRATEQLGRPLTETQIHSVATPEDRAQFVERLRAAPERSGVFCLEDNVSLLLHRALAAAGIACPERVGLLSAMGTDIVLDRQISSLQIDFAGIGRAAGRILAEDTRQTVLLPPQLAAGSTT
ncbi:MAG: LacI family DNA-binding transcriptional regulator [Opitutae bacterium]|nr:LacI family DNA-binding transcriptional regulator [Opitutae bacterium]